MRQLDTDLREATGLRLADFDVLAQLAGAGGELRMTELAVRTLLSRSGLTRRVARLVDEGLVRRANASEDGRGVVVALTDAGVARVTETVPVHLRGVSELFVERLDDQVRAVDGAPGAHRPAANPAEEPGARDLAPQSSAAVPRRGPVRDQRPSLARAAGPAAGRAGRRPRAAAATR